MKQKDIALIIIVAFISALASFFVSKTFFASPKSRQEKVEVVEAISAEFNKPDEKYFNDKSIDPTKLITIGVGGDNNTTPFR